MTKASGYWFSSAAEQAFSFVLRIWAALSKGKVNIRHAPGLAIVSAEKVFLTRFAVSIKSALSAVTEMNINLYYIGFLLCPLDVADRNVRYRVSKMPGVRKPTLLERVFR